MSPQVLFLASAVVMAGGVSGGAGFAVAATATGENSIPAVLVFSQPLIRDILAVDPTGLGISDRRHNDGRWAVDTQKAPDQHRCGIDKRTRRWKCFY